MKIGELTHKIAVSRVHAWRIAKSGIIPDTRTTKGGHHYFADTPKLRKWIGHMRSYKFRKQQLALAYKKDYGSEKLLSQKTFRWHMKFFRRGERKAQKLFSKKYWGEKPVEDYYEDFHNVVFELERFIEDWEKFLKRSEGTNWPRQIRDKIADRFISLEMKLQKFRSAP